MDANERLLGDPHAATSPTSHCRTAAPLPNAAAVTSLNLPPPAPPCSLDTSGDRGELLDDDPLPPAVISQPGGSDTRPTSAPHVVLAVVPSAIQMEISEGVKRDRSSSSLGKRIATQEFHNLDDISFNDGANPNHGDEASFNSFCESQTRLSTISASSVDETSDSISHSKIKEAYSYACMAASDSGIPPLPLPTPIFLLVVEGFVERRLGCGGRVELAKIFHEALMASVSKLFTNSGGTNVGMDKTYPMELQAREFETFTAARVKQLSNDAGFHPKQRPCAFDPGGVTSMFLLSLTFLVALWFPP